MIERKSRQGQHQTALTAGHFGNSSWITLSVYGGSKRSSVAGWSPVTHLSVGVRMYACVSSFESIRLGTAMARIRRSLHTMLLTNSNSKPVSTGWSSVVGWSRTTHLIVGVLRYSCVSSFGGIRLGTARVRNRRSNSIARVNNSVSYL